MKKNWQQTGSPYLLTTIQNGTASAGGLIIAGSNLPNGAAFAVKAAGQVVLISSEAQK